MAINKYDVVVIGTGPGGMAGAIELARYGIHVAVVDEEGAPGGQIYRGMFSESGRTKTHLLGPKYRKGRMLIEEFESILDKIKLLNSTCVWGTFDGNKLALVKDGGNSIVIFEKLLLAEGAMERSVPFSGWTLPGIMTLGGLQKLVVHDQVLPGRRFLLAGCSPLLLPVTKSLLQAGADIILCETTTIPDQMRFIPQLISHPRESFEALSYIIPIIKSRIPVYRPYTIIKAYGQDHVEEVTIAKLDPEQKPIAGSEKTFPVDGVGVSYGFLPSGRLARLCNCAHVYYAKQAYWKPATDEYMRTSDQNIYVAGDSAGIAGAESAEIQGRIAATHIAAQLGHLSHKEMMDRLNTLNHIRDRKKRYFSALEKIFSVKAGLFSIMDSNTIICRCEKIPLKAVQAGIDKCNYRNINEIKRTRAGMGFCQGRTCESITTQIMIQKGIPIDEIGYMSLRPPIVPLPFQFFESWAENDE